jgi:PHP family Zn ribbon phosphoesterase
MRWWNVPVPWCAECDRFFSPSTVRTDGTCPTCGRAVEPGGAHRADEVVPGDHPDELDPLPWHFKLLVAAVALYLGYRAYQGIEWLVHVL